MGKGRSLPSILTAAILSLTSAMLITGCALQLPVLGQQSVPRSSQPEPTKIAQSPTAAPASTVAQAQQPEATKPAPTAAPGSGGVSTQLRPEPILASPPTAAMNVVQVAAKVRPAVVQIVVKGTSLGYFLEPVPTSGVGSGAIIDPRGYIITNNHVIEDAEEMVVTLPDRDEPYSASLVGRDPSTDLAVIQIEADNLPVVTLGDSDTLQVGEPVVAIGNALGLEGGPTVTSGVVSALNRSIDEPNGITLHQLIQTDAAINPGNSGGPLVNAAAQVIGVNTAVATGSSEAPAQGIGFAISINSAKPIIDDLIAYGMVRRPFLGIELATVTPALARQYRLPVERGVYVVRVTRGGPAARAGMEAGDIIVAIEADEIRSVADLRRSINKFKIGQKVKVQVARGTGRRTFEVTLGEMPTP
ncbi:MAG: S1C family serine protease [Sphingomonadaceae bacterium]